MKVEKVRYGGRLCIKINDEIIPPLSFKSFRPTPKNVSDFYKAGLKLYCILTSGMLNRLGSPYSLYGESWIDDETYNFDVIDNQIEMFRENAPGCYYALMIQVDTRDWWLKKHPEYKSTFTHFTQTCGDEEWRALSKKYVQAVIRHVEEKYGEEFFGYFILGGTTTEWFSEYDFEEPIPLKEKLFREYMKDENAIVPPQELRDDDGSKKFVEDKNLVAYRKFSHELIVDTILYFTSAAQEVLNHKKLVGMYYGYLFELWGERMCNVGGFDYERVFESEDIDMISSPSSYMSRSYDSTSGLMLTEQSLLDRDKIYFLEFDHITHLAPQYVEGNPIPGFDSKFKNENQTVDVMRRDFMLCASKGLALWWFDMFEGWFYSDSMMNQIKGFISLSDKLKSIDMKSNTEIAFIAGGKDLIYVNKNTHFNSIDIISTHKIASSIGAPFDSYTQGDIERIDGDKYKFYIFADAINLSESQLDYINRNFRKNGNVLLFIDAPGYISKNTEKVLGIILKKSDIPHHETKSPYGDYKTGVCPEPVFVAEDPDAEALGHFPDGSVALAIKDFGDYSDAYSSMGSVSAGVMRELAKRAGVHIYTNDGTPVYVNDTLTGIYNSNETQLFVREDGVYIDLFDGTKYVAENGRITVPQSEYRAKLLMKE